MDGVHPHPQDPRQVGSRHPLADLPLVRTVLPHLLVAEGLLVMEVNHRDRKGTAEARHLDIAARRHLGVGHLDVGHLDLVGRPRDTDTDAEHHLLNKERSARAGERRYLRSTR